MKICTQCGASKPEADFYLRKNNYRVPECKECSKQRTRNWNRMYLTAEVRAKWDTAKKAKKLAVKDAAFEAYGGYRCVCCGETGKDFLTLDHINNDGADWRRERFGSHLYAGARTYWWLKKHGYPAGFQVLCMNCNWGKRRTGICPHQVRRNDHPLVGVPLSSGKRTAQVDYL